MQNAQVPVQAVRTKKRRNKGERLRVLTWVATFNRALSLRRYRFLRESDGKLLVRGETQWVFVSTETGRPLRIPAELQQAFRLLPQEEEPPLSQG